MEVSQKKRTPKTPWVSLRTFSRLGWTVPPMYCPSDCPNRTPAVWSCCMILPPADKSCQCGTHVLLLHKSRKSFKSVLDPVVPAPIAVAQPVTQFWLRKEKTFDMPSWSSWSSCHMWWLCKECVIQSNGTPWCPSEILSLVTVTMQLSMLLLYDRRVSPSVTRPNKLLKRTEEVELAWFRLIWVWVNTYFHTIFRGLFTSMNPSYFDVNYRGTIGFDTLPYAAGSWTR